MGEAPTGSAAQAAFFGSLFSLKGRTALVTGSSRGIGHAIALGLAQAGANGLYVANAIASGKYPLIDSHLCSNLVGPDVVQFNAGHLVNVDATDPWAVSEAMMTGRKIAEQYMEAMREFHPKAFGGAFLVKTAPSLGVRDSRRIEGDYVFTVQDWLDRNSEKGEYHMQGIVDEKAIFDYVILPLQDENGYKMTPDKFAGRLRAALEEQGVYSSQRIEGNTIFLILEL